MRSIQGRLLRAFLSIIAILTVATIFLFAANYRVTQEYKAISDIMIAEYSLVEDASTLIDAYNVYVQSAGTDATVSEERIERARAHIKEVTRFLDENIRDTQSRSNYIGFKSSADELITQIDESIHRFKESSIKDYFSDYNRANKQYGFVRDNGSVLIFGQLQYSSSIREAVNKTLNTTIVVALLALLFIIVGCIVFVLQFAMRLTRPLRSLTEVTQEFANGNMDTTLDSKILTQQDEIGTLAQSFNAMEEALRTKISELNASNKEIARSVKDIAKKNEELERLNKFMVDRELKMVELKKEIADLERKLKESELNT